MGVDSVFHLYVTSEKGSVLYLNLCDQLCLFVPQESRICVLARPGDTESKQSHFHLAGTKGQLSVKDVMLYMSGSNRSGLFYIVMQARS